MQSVNLDFGTAHGIRTSQLLQDTSISRTSASLLKEAVTVVALASDGVAADAEVLRKASECGY